MSGPLSDKSGWQPTAEGYFFKLARAARDNGYEALIPIQPGKKACYELDWPRWRAHPATDQEIKGWIKKNPRIGFGYAYDCQLIGIDLDILDAAEIDRHVDWLFTHVDGTPMVRIGRAPKVLIVYRAGEGAFGHSLAPEVYWNKGQTVFFGMHPDTGEPYRWQWGSPATRPLSDLPEINGFNVKRFLRHFSGDPNVTMGQGSSSIARFQKFASQNKIEIHDTCLDSVKVIACANEGNRHEVIKCAIAYAKFYGQDRDRIESVMLPAYMALFRAESCRIQRVRLRDFNDVLDWAERKVTKRVANPTGFQFPSLFPESNS